MLLTEFFAHLQKRYSYSRWGITAGFALLFVLGRVCLRVRVGDDPVLL